MSVYTYDGTFEGLLTTLRASWQQGRGEAPVAIRPAAGAQASLFADVLHVDTDEEVARAVWHNLLRYLTEPARARLYHVYLAEEPDSELLIYHYLRQAIAARGRDLSDEYLDDTVRRVLTLSRKLGREKHRMEAFSRFEQSADGLFHVTLQPEVNVLPLLVPHFTARYTDQRWVLYDARRHYGFYHAAGQQHSQLVTDQADVVAELRRAGGIQRVTTSAALAEREPTFQHLWQTYYAHATIAARRNPRLHRRHLPLRYWKYLTEKQPDAKQLLR